MKPARVRPVSEPVRPDPPTRGHTRDGTRPPARPARPARPAPVKKIWIFLEGYDLDRWILIQRFSKSQRSTRQTRQTRGTRPPVPTRAQFQRSGYCVTASVLPLVLHLYKYPYKLILHSQLSIYQFSNSQLSNSQALISHNIIYYLFSIFFQFISTKKSKKNIIYISYSYLAFIYFSIY